MNYLPICRSILIYITLLVILDYINNEMMKYYFIKNIIYLVLYYLCTFYNN